MKAKPDSGSRSSHVTFILIVAASYLATAVALGYSPMGPSVTRVPIVILAGAAYLLLGIFGFTKCRKSESLTNALIYCLIQLALASVLLYLTQTFTIALIMLPLASQCVVLLPTRWLIVICAAIIIIVASPLWLRSGFRLAVVAGSVYLAFLVFIVASTYIGVSERKARTEIERLAAELGEANLKLREYTAKIEKSSRPPKSAIV